MRPVAVVEVFEFAQCVQQVTGIPDQGAVEQFTAAGLYPAFGDRVHSRYPNAGEHDAYPGIREHGIEPGGELAVPISDQEPGPKANLV
jgi:hypothetical protein